MIRSIHKSDLGCFIDNLNFGILMYADDLVLLSASEHHLQLMNNICLEELNDLDLTINIKKSVCIRFGRRFQVLCSSVSIGDTILSWSTNVKHLGIIFTSGYKLLTSNWQDLSCFVVLVRFTAKFPKPMKLLLYHRSNHIVYRF